MTAKSFSYWPEKSFRANTDNCTQRPEWRNIGLINQQPAQPALPYLLLKDDQRQLFYLHSQLQRYIL